MSAARPSSTSTTWPSTDVFTQEKNLFNASVVVKSSVTPVLTANIGTTETSVARWTTP